MLLLRSCVMNRTRNGTLGRHKLNMRNNATVCLANNPGSDGRKQKAEIDQSLLTSAATIFWRAPRPWGLMLFWSLMLGCWQFATAADWPQWGGGQKRNSVSSQ